MVHNDDFFHVGEILAQQSYNSEESWTPQRRKELLWDEIPQLFHERFSKAPWFLLATSDGEGRCDCSFKGGGEGLIHLIDSRTFAFPDFDGNGAFMSIGNILVNPHVGCLFIDFQDGARLRVNGRASVFSRDEYPELLPTPIGLFATAPRLVLVNIEQVIPNCARFVPRMSYSDGGAE